MNRIVKINIADKEYPLVFSVRAAKEAFERYQDLAGIQRAILNEGDPDVMINLLDVMLREGARYLRLTNGLEITPPGAEDLGTLIPFYDAEIRGALTSAILNGSISEIELETDPKKA